MIPHLKANKCKSTYNKSLHPIRPCVPAFAWCSCGAANAGPPVRTGELNRYAVCARNNNSTMNGNRPSVMISRLKEVDSILGYKIDNSVLFCKTPRPNTRRKVL